MKLIDKSTRGRRGQTSGKVVIVMQRGNPADAGEKVFVLIIGVGILIEGVSER